MTTRPPIRILMLPPVSRLAHRAIILSFPATHLVEVIAHADGWKILEVQVMQRRKAIHVDKPREVLIDPWQSRRIQSSLKRVVLEVTDADYRSSALPCLPFEDDERDAA